jgi:FkbM family methyltransferase
MLIPFSELVSKHNINVNGILHIGAHHCEEMKSYLDNNISNLNIYWIEGNPEIVKLMKSKGINQIYQGVIDQENDKDIIFNITNNGESSSILQFGTHKINHPQVKVIDNIHIKTIRADTVIEKNNIPIENLNFLNLDIQGVELRALKSMEKYLKYIDYIYTEVNTEEVYVNCDKMKDITDYLSQFNFKLADARIYRKFGWGDAFYVKQK